MKTKEENNFLKNIRFLKSSNKITQHEIASAIGVNRCVIGSYFEGRSQPKFDTLIKIAALFKCSIDDLITENMESKSNLKSDIKTTKNCKDEVANKRGFADWDLLPLLQYKEAINEAMELYAEQFKPKPEPKKCYRCKQELAHNISLCISCQMDDRPIP